MPQAIVCDKTMLPHPFVRVGPSLGHTRFKSSSPPPRRMNVSPKAFKANVFSTTSAAALRLALAYTALYLLYTSFSLRRIEALDSLADDLNASEKMGETRTNVRVWSPHVKSCHGDFAYREPNTSSSSRPAIMLRDAAIDKRHNSLHELEVRQSPESAPFRRVVLQVSVMPGTLPIHPIPELNVTESEIRLPSAFLSGVNSGRTKGWKAQVDHIINEPYCHFQFHKICSTRTSLNSSNYHCIGSQWQIVVSLRGPTYIRTDESFQSALDELGQSVSDISRLELRLPILPRETEKVLYTELSVALTCISGLVGRKSLHHLIPALPPITKCADARGSVVVAGGALFGHKRNSPQGRKEAASFAARSLLGSVRFDMVAVPVIAKYSVAQIHSICGGEEKCVSGYHEKNEDFMLALAHDMQDELKILKVPEKLWNRIALFPVCRLGTHFVKGAEKDDGCKLDFHFGQIMVNQISYTLFSPYYKWFASYDIDEFIVDHRGKNLTRVSSYAWDSKPNAAGIFDESDFINRLANMGTPGSLKIKWATFALDHEMERNATRSLIEKGALQFKELINKTGKEVDISVCMQTKATDWWVSFGAGKAAVSCSNGGFGVQGHDPYYIADPSSLKSLTCNYRGKYVTDILLYHARRKPRFGNCAWY